MRDTIVGQIRTAAGFLTILPVMPVSPAQRETVDWHGPRPTVIVALDVLRGDQLYSIYCFVPPGKESHPGLQHFLDSFDLLPL